MYISSILLHKNIDLLECEASLYLVLFMDFKNRIFQWNAFEILLKLDLQKKEVSLKSYRSNYSKSIKYIEHKINVSSFEVSCIVLITLVLMLNKLHWFTTNLFVWEKENQNEISDAQKVVLIMEFVTRLKILCWNFIGKTLCINWLKEVHYFFTRASIRIPYRVKCALCEIQKKNKKWNLLSGKLSAI